MYSPIPGATEKRNAFQANMVTGGVEVTNTYPNFNVALKNSTWGKRGWTHEEAVLSTRKLFFTPFEVWFECKSPHAPYAQEDGYGLPRNPESQPRFFLRSPSSTLSDFENFDGHLAEYTSRSLSNQSDILNAFSGILTSLYPGHRCLYGLPEPDFDRAMLWFWGTRDRLIPGREIFPSWSWTSVMGQVTYRHKYVFIPARNFMGPLVKWAYKDRDGNLKTVRSFNGLVARSDHDSSSLTPIKSPQVHLLIAWFADCIESAPPDDLKRVLEDAPEDMSRVVNRWPSVAEVWDAINNARNSRPSKVQGLDMGLKIEDQSLINRLRPGVLITRAQTAFFYENLDDKCISKSPNQDPRQMNIVDSENRSVGAIFHIASNPRDGNANSTGSNAPRRCFELMAISLSSNLLLDSIFYSHPHTRDPRHDSYRDIPAIIGALFPGIRSTDPQGPAVNVLVIEWAAGSPFARRTGVGLVNPEDWIYAKRSFKTIGLE